MAKDDKSSVNRKAEIISAAIEVFAETGYYRATTAQVAERAKISQPYVFRFCNEGSTAAQRTGAFLGTDSAILSTGRGKRSSP